MTALPERPRAVTLACWLSIALGALAVLFGAGITLAAAVGAQLPEAATDLRAIFGVFPFSTGALAILAGAQGLRRAPWARWTMIALFALGAVFAILAAPLGLVALALDAAGIALLAARPARAWFADAG